MAEQGVHKIQGLCRRWVFYQVLAAIALSVAIAVITGCLLNILLLVSFLWAIAVFAIVLTGLLWLHSPWKMSAEKIAAFLNQQYPQLQESTQLLLVPTNRLNVLQSIAVGKTEAELLNLKVGHRPFAKRFLKNLLLLFIALIITGLVCRFYKGHSITDLRAVNKVAPASPAVKEVVLPQISSVEVTVTPPAYTKRPKHTQDKFNLMVEEGAEVKWYIKTNIAVKNAQLVFNDKEHIALKGDKNNTNWYVLKNLIASGFYQVSIDGKLSDLYQIQIVKDGPPVIHIKSPKQYTYIDAGETPQVTINATLTDDYGIANAQIMATVAKGKGEGVKFKEYKLNFSQGFSAQNPQYTVQKLINLPSLNMEPGDELYFYVQAQDTHQQLSRTDVYTVSIQDTAELLSMNGVIAGVNLKPEFFRSERQIIIDAERLIKEKDSIGVEKFNSRSNDLGIDQKLLRLRYGKFLGEEDEGAIGSHDDHDHGAADPADFSNAAKILKEYTDDHDNAEDAGFFEPAIKAQLKATLTEMWKAELQLRLYKPEKALPFAYKALRLLKDLQQKSRSYVAKTAYNPAPLKPEKRLSGELDKIIAPFNKQEINPPADELAALKKAVNVLESLKINALLKADDAKILQQANQQLSLKASVQPGIYLPALNAMRRILLAQKVNLADINIVERALQKTLNALKVQPGANSSSADMGLSKQYYKNLKTANK